MAKRARHDRVIEFEWIRRPSDYENIDIDPVIIGKLTICLIKERKEKIRKHRT